MTDEELQAAIAARPKIKIHKEYIESRIFSHDYLKMTATLTVCIMQFDSGYQIVGKSACAHPDNYDKDIGEGLAYRDCIAQAWPLFGFLLCEALHAGGHSFEDFIRSVNGENSDA